MRLKSIMFIILIISVSTIAQSQYSETYDHLSDKQMHILKKDLRSARKMTIAGTAAHLGGFALCFSSIPMFLFNNELGTSFLLAGFCSISAGPALSSGGANRVRRIYRRSDLATIDKTKRMDLFRDGIVSMYS